MSKSVRIGAVAENDGADPVVGVNWDSALLDDDLVAVNRAGNFTGHRFDVRHIGVSALGGRRADGDEDRFAPARGGLQVAGELDALAAMPRQEFGKKFFVDRNVAGAESFQLFLVVIDEHDFMTEIGKTDTGNQSYISRTYDCDTHASLLLGCYGLFAPPARRCAKFNSSSVGRVFYPQSQITIVRGTGMGNRTSQVSVTGVTAVAIFLASNLVGWPSGQPALAVHFSSCA